MPELSIVVPDECQQNPRVWAYLENTARTSGIIDEVLVFDLRESMRNGGGPACLRLRVELADVEAKVQQLNVPGQLLPGVKLDTVYDRSELIERTTHTVRENVLVGIGLVVLILLVFLNDFRSAFIVAINIPLALLFAFATLFLLGKSTNLLFAGKLTNYLHQINC